MKKIDKSDFETDIPESKYLVDFNATWCAPCIALKPILESLEKEQSIAIYSLDIDDLPLAAAKYGIRSVPTVMLMKDGKPVEQLIGSRKKAEYEKLLALA